jgi:hypothetical protein
MAGTFEFTDFFFFLPKLIWFAFMCMCLFDSSFAGAFIIVGLWAVV